MKIKFKKLHPSAVTPTRAKRGDAGFDLVAMSVSHDLVNMNHVCKTGIAVEIPTGYFGAVFPRSSIKNFGMMLSNSVGVIDSGYRGEITFNFRYVLGVETRYQPGDRIGQLIILPLPEVEFEEVAELSQTERGTGGFGSTGK